MHRQLCCMSISLFFKARKLGKMIWIWGELQNCSVQLVSEWVFYLNLKRWRVCVSVCDVCTMAKPLTKVWKV
jgi:hypothetical protein